jgi:hypothetical protein
MPMKIIGTMNPMEIGIILMNDEHYGLENAREIVIRELVLKPRWIDLMLERKVLGHAFK